MDSAWCARALIDIGSLRHNINQIRQVTQARLMAVIKSDAYGHGLETICAAAHKQVDAFAVATIDEGIRCRRVQENKPIIVLSELWQQNQLQHFEQHRLQVVLHNQQQARWLQEYRGTPLSLWIKFDSGMNRLGVAAEDVAAVYKQFQGMNTIKQIRLMSHLANADIIGDEFTNTQLAIFNHATNPFKCEKSLANSAALMRWQATHFSWVRPGLMLYGVAPYNQQNDKKTPPFDLKQVMQLQARLIAVKTIGRNQAVGYGGIFHTQRISKIAMIGFGYGDGYPRLEDPRACVLINNQRAPIIGRVSMNIITVDVTDLEDVKAGDTAILWGHGLGVDEVAQWADTIPYDLLCRVTAQVPRFSLN